MRKAVLSVIGRVNSETLALVFALLSESGCDVLECYKRDLSSVSFMIAEVELPSALDVGKLKENLAEVERKCGCKVTIQDSELYEYMHRV